MPSEHQTPEFRQDRFDSEHLGCVAYKLWLRDHTPEASELSKLFDAAGAELVCTFSSYSVRNIEVMQRLGFRLIGVRDTYELSLASEPSVPALPPDVELVLAEAGRPPVSREDLVGLAEALGAAGRYLKDPGIPRARGLALYLAWLSNSLHAGYADAVVLAMRREALLGIHTIRIVDRIAYVDLLGVQASAQGTGLGSALLARGLVECAKRGISRVRVVTENENVGASRFYQRHGFLLCSMELVWHGHRAPR